MGYLIHFVLAFAALAADENGLGHLFELPLGVLLLAAVPHLLLALTRREFLRGHFRVAQFTERALIWSPPALYLAALAIFGWGAAVEAWTGIETGRLLWPHPAELLALAPFAVYGLVSIDARARVADTRDTEIARTRRFHQRMFATGLVPLSVLVLGAWSLSTNPILRTQLEEVALFSGLLAVLTVVAFVLVLPSVLMHLWDTQPMPSGPRRTALEELAGQASFRCREILVWITGNRMANAAVLGLSGRTRVVLFTDALLTQLSLRELRAVFAHEMGHAHHRHALTFLAWALGYFLAVDLVSAQLPITSEPVTLGLLAVAFLLWLVGFGWLSRRVELEADLFSLEQTGDLHGLVCALERVGGSHVRKIASWRHFSTEARIEQLVLAATDPERGRRQHRRLKWIARAGLVLMLVTTTLEAFRVVDQYPMDRLRADFRMGEYESARVRLQGMEDGEASLARMLRRGVELGDGASPRELSEAARAALRSSDLEAALDYTTLAVWRGDYELEPVFRALTAHRAGEPTDLEGVNEDWRPDLERALRTGSR